MNPVTSARLVAGIIARRGITIFLPNGVPVQGDSGSPIKAILEDNEREINRQVRQDSLMPEKRVFLWRFSANAAGRISPGMKFVAGGITYLVDTPLHPSYNEDTLVYLGVVTHQF